MIFLQFYRMYLAGAVGILTCFLLHWSIFPAITVAILFRIIWFFIEKLIIKIQVNIWFKKHAPHFKVLTGPYGIRLINQCDKNQSIKNSLAEVFTPDLRQLKKTIEHLEIMDTLFRSGMRPDGDTYQLHDLKLKYGNFRISNETVHVKDSAHE